jgi:uncharacterized protein YgiM (DUF1202 family)
MIPSEYFYSKTQILIYRCLVECDLPFYGRKEVEMNNKRKSILILLVLTAVLAAFAPGWLKVAPIRSEPEPVAPSTAVAEASATPAAGGQETDVHSGEDSQPLPNPPAAEDPKPIARGRVTVQGLNLRAGPSVNHVILGLLSEGTELEIQGRSENREWLLVKPSSGIEGWVYFAYVDSQVVIADLPLKEAYGGPDSYPSSSPQDVRQPLNVQVSIENDLAIVYIAGFPGDSKVIAWIGEVDGPVDMQVGQAVTSANGNAVLRFQMPAAWSDGRALTGDELMLVVSSDDNDVRVDARVQYFHN